LLSTLTPELRSPADPHWQAGVTYEPLCGGSGTTFEECFSVTGVGFAPPTASKVDTGGLDRRGATAFTVYDRVDCSAPGFWERAEEVVGELLTETEQWQVERTFWTGVAGGQTVVFPHLAANAPVLDESGIVLQTAAVTVTGAALDVVEGLGRLESTVADCYSGVAVIHVPRTLAPALANAQLLVRDGTRYRTHNGNLVVLGAGYRGTAPDGSTPSGSAWVYATGAMFIYRGRPVILPIRDSVDRAENTINAIAERTYVIGWDCCHVGVNLSTGGIITGAVNGAS
jgi:hypothetical protein